MSSGDRLPLPVKQIGILYHPKRVQAIAFSHKLEKFLHTKGILPWLCSAWEPEKARPQVTGSDLILSVGGDGTILRTARVIIPDSVPILGINLGDERFFDVQTSGSNETNVEGIFLAGACRGPRNIPESIADGVAAAKKAMEVSAGCK